MQRRECPACGLTVDGVREACPACLATLVDDADATIACRLCGHVCPARMHSCPSCLALLRPDAEAVEEHLARELAEGRRLHRPVDRDPFASGPSCTVLRLVAGGGLVVCGPEGLIEANLVGGDDRAVAPLVCSTGGRTLFRLERYEAAARALVAVDAAGAALGTYLHRGSVLDRVVDVRDETSAPVARFEPATGTAHQFQVVETGGGVLGTGSSRDVELGEWIDDEWSLTAGRQRMPMEPLAFVALAVAVKVLFGRPTPTPKQQEQPSWVDR